MRYRVTHRSAAARPGLTQVLDAEMQIDPSPNFPALEWAPIQNLDSIDIVGKRKDGGVDLVIVVSQPLDGSADTLAALRQKVSLYFEEIEAPEFREKMQDPREDQITVIIACAFPIHPWATAVLEEFQAQAADRGFRVVVNQERV